MDDWCYFSAVLKECNIWRLESLPPLNDAGPISSIYFNTAYCVRSTLKELTLHQGMLPLNDLARLSGFKQLNKVNIAQSVLENVYDLRNLLKYVPNLVSLHVGELQCEIGRHESNNNNNITITYHHRIMELSMCSYMPNSDKEFYTWWKRVQHYEIWKWVDMSAIHGLQHLSV